MPKLKLDSLVLEQLENQGLVPFNDTQMKLSSGIKSGQNLWMVVEELEELEQSIAATLLHKLKSSFEDVARAVVLVPSKVEADRLEELFQQLGKHTDLRVWTAYEGPQILKQKEDIYFGADVVIATPKRLNELLNIEGFNSSSVQTLILYKAEALLKVGVTAYTQRISDSFPFKQRLSITLNKDTKVRTYMDRYAHPFNEWPL